MQTISCDVLIIGAGPAGSVAAANLVKEGHKVLVVEKSTFPRFVIGESLLPVSLNHLENAGLLGAVKKQNFTIKKGARFYRGGKGVSFSFQEQFTKGYTYAYQVPRADFDKTLIEEVEKMGARVLYNTKVVSFEGSLRKQFTSASHNEEQIRIESKFTIDASGRGMVLSNLLHLKANLKNNTPMAAAFVHSKDQERENGQFDDQIDFHVLSQMQWFWSIPFSNGVTSLGYVAPPSTFSGMSIKGKESFFRDVFKKISEIEKRFTNQQFTMDIQYAANYAVKSKKIYGNGYVLIGHTTEFLDPIFSSGVALATASAERAAHLVNKQLNGEKVSWKDDYKAYMDWATNVFRTYVNKWYSGELQDIFFSSLTNAATKRQICSVLSGYVWDLKNPYVKRHTEGINNLAALIRRYQASKKMASTS